MLAPPAALPAWLLSPDSMGVTIAAALNRAVINLNRPFASRSA